MPNSANSAANTSSTASSQLSLSGYAYDSGIKLTWSLNGTAPKGFKVVKGLSPNPSYGKDEAIYVSGSSERAYAWKITDGKTYHFRICIYNSDGCTAYSNNITVTAPKKQESNTGALPSGTLALMHNGANNFSWTLNGSAPYGYKLVWATGSQPVYPGSDYQYYSSKDTKSGTITTLPGTYNVRVCMYNTSGTGDKCLNYSNQITVTIP